MSEMSRDELMYRMDRAETAGFSIARIFDGEGTKGIGFLLYNGEVNLLHIVPPDDVIALIEMLMQLLEGDL